MPLCVLRDADEITTSLWLDAIMGFATVHCHTSFFSNDIFFLVISCVLSVTIIGTFFFRVCVHFLLILLLVGLLLHFFYLISFIVGPSLARCLVRIVFSKCCLFFTMVLWLPCDLRCMIFFFHLME